MIRDLLRTVTVCVILGAIAVAVYVAAGVLADYTAERCGVAGLTVSCGSTWHPSEEPANARG